MGAGNVVQTPSAGTTFVKDPRDIQEAKDLLAAAGYENFTSDLAVPTAGDWEPIAVVMRQQLLNTLGWDFTLKVGDLALSTASWLTIRLPYIRFKLRLSSGHPKPRFR